MVTHINHSLSRSMDQLIKTTLRLPLEGVSGETPSIRLVEDESE